MKKKVVSILMCAALGATMLAGCGSSDTGTSDASTSDASTSDAATSDTATDDGAGDTAASGDLIKIGFAQVGHESDWRTASTNSCVYLPFFLISPLKPTINLHLLIKIGILP